MARVEHCRNLKGEQYWLQATWNLKNWTKVLRGNIIE